MRPQGAPTPASSARPATTGAARSPTGGRPLTQAELAMRQRVLAEQQRESARREADRREQEKILILSAAEEARRAAEEARRAAEEAARLAAEEARAQPAAPTVEAAAPADQAAQARAPSTAPGAARVSNPATRAPARPATPTAPTSTLRLGAGREDEEDRPVRRAGGLPVRRTPTPVVAKKGMGDSRRGGRIDVAAAIEGEDEKTRSLASVTPPARPRTPPGRTGTPAFPTRCASCATWCCPKPLRCRNSPIAWRPAPPTWSRR